MTTPSAHDDGTQCHDVEDCRLTEPLIRTLLEREADEIARHFEGIFSRETVLDCVEDSYEQLSARASVHTHLPVLAARFAHQRLDATAKNQGDHVSTTPEVLFVCVHNAGRSQMAAALLHHHAQGSVLVRSAGSAPADTINPAVVAAMDELGLVSAHLKILTDARFVLAQRRGTARLYQVNQRCVSCFPSAADVVMGKAAVPFTEVTCTSTPQEATA